MSLEIKKFDMSKIQFKDETSRNQILSIINKRGVGRRWIIKDQKYYDENNKQK